jgi:hypothetical protein
MLRWEGHITSNREMREACDISVGRTDGKRPLGRVEHLGVEGKIILKCILQE